MKASIRALAFFATAILSLVEGDAIRVQIDPASRQTLTSFGASGGWWPNDLVHFPTAAQEQLGEFLFSEQGLWLSSYRYYVGGAGGNDAQEAPAERRVESFLLRNGTYDWTRDQAGVSFLRMAQEYLVPYITFFVVAAPSHIATNGAACGWNMTAEKVKPFAEYVSNVVFHWFSEGIDVKYISPFNEPVSNRADCGQEGTVVPIDIRPDVFRGLRMALDNSNASSVGVIGDETSRIVEQALLEYPDWLPGSAPYLSDIAVHNYDFPGDADLEGYYDLIQSLGDDMPPVKFTETCCATTTGTGPGVYNSGYDPTMKSALLNARYIWQFLTIVQATSYDWWTIVTFLPCSPTVEGSHCYKESNTSSTFAYDSGLLYIDVDYNKTHDYNVYTTKRAFMVKHFSYFHRPGSVRHDVSQAQLPFGVNAVASTWEDDATWSVLFMNNQTTAFDFNLQAPCPSGRVSRVVETTNEEDWKDVQPVPEVRKGEVALHLPGESLVTAQFTC